MLCRPQAVAAAGPPGPGPGPQHPQVLGAAKGAAWPDQEPRLGIGSLAWDHMRLRWVRAEKQSPGRRGAKAERFCALQERLVEVLSSLLCRKPAACGEGSGMRSSEGSGKSRRSGIDARDGRAQARV